jgi:hypothetical protein
VFAKHSKLLSPIRLTSPRSIVDRVHAVKKGKSMFVELMPLIEKRALTITVAALGDVSGSVSCPYGIGGG